jgi:hypothetical protein
MARVIEVARGAVVARAVEVDLEMWEIRVAVHGQDGDPFSDDPEIQAALEEAKAAVWNILPSLVGSVTIIGRDRAISIV